MTTLLIGYGVLALVKALDAYGVWLFYGMRPHVRKMHRLPPSIAAAYLGLTWPAQLAKLYIRRES